MYPNQAIPFFCCCIVHFRHYVHYRSSNFYKSLPQDIICIAENSSGSHVVQLLLYSTQSKHFLTQTLQLLYLFSAYLFGFFQSPHIQIMLQEHELITLSDLIKILVVPSLYANSGSVDHICNDLLSIQILMSYVLLLIYFFSMYCCFNQWIKDRF